MSNAVVETIHPSGRTRKYPAKQGALLSRPNTSLPAGWNTEISDTYEYEVIDTTDWNYTDNFSQLNTYEKHFWTCACCDTDIMACLWNESIYWGAEDWQKYMKSKPQPSPLTSTIRRRGKLIHVLTPELLQEARDLVGSIGITKTARELNIPYLLLSQALKSEGVVVKLGRKANHTQSEITPEILQQAREMVGELGIVKTARELGVLQPALSQALKSEGFTFPRGRKGTKAYQDLTEDLIQQASVMVLEQGLTRTADKLQVRPYQLSTALKLRDLPTKRVARMEDLNDDAIFAAFELFPQMGVAEIAQDLSVDSRDLLKAMRKYLTRNLTSEEIVIE